MGGLTKSDLVQNKRGKIVSKKLLANGKKAYANIKVGLSLSRRPGRHLA